MVRRRKRKQSELTVKGRAALEEIEARQRSWVVIPLAETYEEEDGLVVVNAPRFRGRAGKGLVSLLRRSRTYNLRLDGFGSHVWRLIDGHRNVGQIADAMVERFGEDAEPALYRLLPFLRSLQNTGVVRVVTRENAEKGFK